MGGALGQQASEFNLRGCHREQIGKVKGMQQTLKEIRMILKDVVWEVLWASRSQNLTQEVAIESP